jgi:hypothetical protein
MNHSAVRFLLANIYIAAAFCARTGIRALVWTLRDEHRPR